VGFTTTVEPGPSNRPWQLTMFYRLSRLIAQSRFDAKCRHILNTPPVAVDRGTAVIASMLCHRDLLMYLVAIKSFISRFGPARVAVLDDGTLTDRDKALLAHHLPAVSITHIGTIALGPCPTRACFERLLFVAHLAQHDYIVELDADTVTTGPIPEVVEAVAASRPFILGTMANALGSSLVPARLAAEWASSQPDDHPQTLAEQRFPRLDRSDELRYVRGSAALVGFPPRCFTREDVHEWSVALESLVGRDAWWVWGAEQTIVNLIVANSVSGAVLPFGKYMCHPSDADYRRCAFMHFYSPYRFTSGIYATVARDAASFLHRSMASGTSGDRWVDGRQ
jgi:hypothetical protein